ncbi:MAG: MoaD/ThiS family protein [Gemmatimonadota bacterium]
MTAPTSSGFEVTVRFLARYAELVGREAVSVRVSAPATVADVVAAARGALPQAASLPSRPLCALNYAHALLDTPVAPGDEVALLPPVAGG